MNPYKTLRGEKLLREKVGPASELPAPDIRRCAQCHDRIKHEEESVYCGPDCLAAAEEVSQAVLRKLVLERDKGVCSSCGRDCLALRELFNHEKENLSPSVWRVRLLRLDKDGFDEDAVDSGAALWEAAHVRAKVEGGANRPENCVTLCVVCHKGDSSRLAQKRKVSRRPRGRFGR